MVSVVEHEAMAIDLKDETTREKESTKAREDGRGSSFRSERDCHSFLRTLSHLPSVISRDGPCFLFSYPYFFYLIWCVRVPMISSPRSTVFTATPLK
jgi:hypothetical protein